jgi:tRNA dimethylallyltransferase
MPLHDPASLSSPRLIVLVGPTAVGKTELSLQLAEKLAAEIISADSRLFYIGMDIGTAKPSVIDRQRVPHHLVDVTKPDATWSLALFQQAAHLAIIDINHRGKLPVLVGGTGQYIRAVVEGWQAPAVSPDPALRKALDRLATEIGAQELHQRLAVLDPEAAATIDYRNVRRTVRAIEVIFSSGRRFSAQRQRTSPPYHTLVLGLTRPRAELYERIDHRIDTMLANGWVDEVQALLAEGYAPDLPAFSAIGYRELIAHLQGKLTLEEAVERIRRQSRIFVRRQANWFKLSDPNIHWFQAGDATLPDMVQLVQNWLFQTDQL